MADVLIDEWKIQGKVIVLYDKPQSHFKRLNVNEVHQVHLYLI